MCRVLSSWFLFPLIRKQNSVTGWKPCTLASSGTIYWSENKWYTCLCCPVARECSLLSPLILVISQNAFETLCPQRSLPCSFLPQKQLPLPTRFPPTWVTAPPPLHLNHLCGSWSPFTLLLCSLPTTHTPNVRKWTEWLKVGPRHLPSLVFLWGSNTMLNEEQMNGREGIILLV